MKRKTTVIIAVCVLGAAVLIGAILFSLPGGSGKKLSIIYPYDRSLFPPEIAPTEFSWSDGASGAEAWRIRFDFEDGGKSLTAWSDSIAWVPDPKLWETVKKRTTGKKATVTVQGMQSNFITKLLSLSRPLSAGKVVISTSPDSAGAPIFYRDVPLPFNFAKEKMELIQWRLGDISKSERPPIVLTNLPVCGNCHSFSRDASMMAMDVDSGGDKGAYVISPVEEEIFFTRDKLITWNDFRRSQGKISFGLLAQISPNGKYVASTVQDRVIFLGKEGSKIEFSQLFFPVTGIIAFYDREKKQILPLPGADDPDYCQSNPSWSPDGKYLIFSRAPLREFVKTDKTKNIVLSLAQSAIFLGGEQYLVDSMDAPPYTYSLYRIPFNDGKGGKPEPVPGASENGVSNYFPKYSPDGKWMIFCKARSFMLLQPDSRLWIMPADFSAPPRELKFQTSRMNSWHSWSPNSRWLVFSSKEHSPYTELFLKHIDEQGNDSPPVRLSAFSANDRARNIPEFVNIRQGGIKQIHESFVDYFSYMRKGEIQEALNKLPVAEEAYRTSINMNPDFADTHRKLAYLLIRENRIDEAQKEYEIAFRLQPKDPLGHQNLGEIYYAKKDYDGARKEFEATLKLNPKYSAAHAGMGMVYLARGEKARARSALENAVRLDPDNADAQYSLSTIYEEAKEYTKAIATIKLAIRSDKYGFDPTVFNRLGTIYLIQEDFDNAQKSFEFTLKIDPDDAGAIHSLGIVYLKKGDTANAERMFRIAFKLNPENPAVIFMLAQVLSKNDKSIPEAISLYTKGLSLSPRNTQGYVDIGNLFIRVGDRGNALVAFEKALELSPGSKDLRKQVDALKK
jgi:tetratricopeptide (TPR) repeat protein